MRNIIKVFALIASSVFLLSCSSKLGKTIGLSTSGPDEYSVGNNRPLEMPPHFDLDTIEDAKKNPPVSNSNDSSLNPGEKALLEASQK